MEYEKRTVDTSYALSCILILLVLMVLFSPLFVWLDTRDISEPKCFIGALYVPALNKALNSSTSKSTILFMLEFYNTNTDKGVLFENVNLNFGVFLDRNRTTPLGNSTIEGFNQGYQNKVNKWGSAEIDAGGLNQTPAADGKTYFRVNYTTSVKYKVFWWYTKPYSLWGGANVAVDDSGQKVGYRGIVLGDSRPVIGSGAPKLAGCYWTLLIVGLLVNFLYLGFPL